MGIAAQEPCPVVEPETLDYQRVSIPAADRISHPTRIGVGLQYAAVHVDLTVGEIVVEDSDHRWSLEELLHAPECGVDRTLRQTFVMRVVLAVVFRTLLDQRLRPRLNVGGLEVPDTAFGDIAARAARLP